MCVCVCLILPYVTVGVPGWVGCFVVGGLGKRGVGERLFDHSPLCFELIVSCVQWQHPFHGKARCLSL